jgi:hypothetical protein
MDIWLCHEKKDQCCYFSVLSMAMNDSVYRDITRKTVDSDSSDMRTKVKVNWFASLLTCIHGSINYVMWTYIGNACDVEREETCFSRDRKCLQYHEPRVWDTYIIIILKGIASRLVLKSLVYELLNCRCIASRTTYLSVWRLLILVNSFQEGDVEFIWSVCEPNELRLKMCIRTYSDDLISIYVYILCIFRRYKRNTKENKK